MSLSLVVLLMLHFVQEAYANSNLEVTELCDRKLDKATCLKQYENLPNLNDLPNLPIRRPIKLKVIPYKG